MQNASEYFQMNFKYTLNNLITAQSKFMRLIELLITITPEFIHL